MSQSRSRKVPRLALTEMTIMLRRTVVTRRFLITSLRMWLQVMMGRMVRQERRPLVCSTTHTTTLVSASPRSSPHRLLTEDTINDHKLTDQQLLSPPPWSRCTQTSLLTKIVSGFVTFSDSSILVCVTPD